MELFARTLILFALYLPLVHAGECDSMKPGWIVCEDFEDYAGDFTAWLDASPWLMESPHIDPGRITIADNMSFQGAKSLYMPAAASSGYEGSYLTWADCEGTKRNGCTLLGKEELYLRAYIRFPPDHKKVHHFMTIGGSQPDGFWKSMGLAGCRPDGKISAGTTVDFHESTRKSFFYTYTPDMGCDPGYVCDRYSDATQVCSGCATRGLPCLQGEECCWGNHYPKTQTDESVIPRDQWVCLEMMMKLNTPGEKDGVMAYWIDGKLIHQEDTMLFRTIPGLKMNKATLQHYITTGGANGHSNRMWWDNAIVSTERIGCLDYCHEADADSDLVLTAEEMAAHLADWQKGLAGMRSLFSAIKAWKHGCASII